MKTDVAAHGRGKQLKATHSEEKSDADVSVSERGRRQKVRLISGNKR